MLIMNKKSILAKVISLNLQMHAKNVLCTRILHSVDQKKG